MKSVRPTKFTGVPRVWEKIKDKMMDAEAQASPLKKAIMNWAKSAALENHQQVMEGKRGGTPFTGVTVSRLLKLN